MAAKHERVGTRCSARLLLAIAALLISVLMPSSHAAAQTFTVLHYFTGGADGGNPTTSLVEDANGNLYGTASVSNYPQPCPPNCGVVFVLSPSGRETVLHTFTGAPDGALPSSGLTPDLAGNAYGLTEYGGTGACDSNQGPPGCGTVYRINRAGEEVLYSFPPPLYSQAPLPISNLIRDSSGNLYGTTQRGGNNYCPIPYNNSCGTVFEINPNGNETTLYSFQAGPDGDLPYSPLLRDSAGNLYGATLAGGNFSELCL